MNGTVLSILSLLACLHIVCGVTNTNGKQCDFRDPKSRKGCPGSFGGITRAQCEGFHDCCFDDLTKDTVWCFKNPDNDYTNPGFNNECDYGNPRSRIALPLGFGGISKAQCEAMNGCFDDQVPDVIWCFKKNAHAQSGPRATTESARAL